MDPGAQIARHRVARRAPVAEEVAMLRRWLHQPLLWSPILAVVVQLVLAAATAAVTGGGDFPIRR